MILSDNMYKDLNLTFRTSKKGSCLVSEIGTSVLGHEAAAS